MFRRRPNKAIPARGAVSVKPVWHAYIAIRPAFIDILCECLVLEKVRMQTQTLGFAKMNPGQIKEARVSGIITLGNGVGLDRTMANRAES